MLTPYVKQLLTVFYILLVLLVFTGAKQSAQVKPPWLEGTGDIPCDAVGGIISGEIGSGETKGFSIDLEAGSYVVAGWGSWDLTALRMAVRTDSDEVIGQDNGNDNSPIISFELEDAGSVMIVLTAGETRMDSAIGTFSFTVMRGVECFEREHFPAKEVLETWTSIIIEENATLIHWEVISISGEESINFTHELPPGCYMVVAETTNPFDDIDMYVRINSDTVSQDELPNNYPICRFEIEREEDVTIEVDPWEYGIETGSGLVFMIARDNEAEE